MGSCVWVSAGAHRGQGQRRAWGRVEGSAVWPTCGSSGRAAPNAESSPPPQFLFCLFFLITYGRKIDNFVCLFLIQFNTNEGPIKIVKRQYQYIKIYTMDFKNQYCNKTWENSSGRLGLLRSTQTGSCLIRLSFFWQDFISTFKWQKNRRTEPSSYRSRATEQLVQNEVGRMLPKGLMRWLHHPKRWPWFLRPI